MRSRGYKFESTLPDIRPSDRNLEEEKKKNHVPSKEKRERNKRSQESLWHHFGLSLRIHAESQTNYNQYFVHK